MSDQMRSETHTPEVDPYLTEHVRDRLAEDGRTNELEVTVTVVGKKVFLAGTVTNEDRRRSIGDVVAELLPDFEIHNQTSVGEFGPAEHAEELR